MTAAASRVAIDKQYRTSNHAQVYGLANDLANSIATSNDKSRTQCLAWIAADAIAALSSCARCDDPGGIVAGNLWALMVRLDSTADLRTEPPLPYPPTLSLAESAAIDRAMDIEAEDRRDQAVEATA